MAAPDLFEPRAIPVGRFEHERLIRASDLPPMTRLVAFAVETFAESKTGAVAGKYAQSLTDLQAATGLARSSVAKHLGLLEVEAWLRRMRPDKARQLGEKAPTEYQLTRPAASPSHGLDEPASSPPHGPEDEASSPPHGPELVRHTDRTSPPHGQD